MVKILIVGPNGNMGRAMIQSAYNNPNVCIVGGIAPKDREYIGIDLGYLAGIGKNIGAKVVDSIEDIIDECSVILDCSFPSVSIEILNSCLKHNKPFVTGTTGFTVEEKNQIVEAGKIIPVLPASNTSKVVHQLFSIVKSTAQKLGIDADIYITEMHNKLKRDAPSGTAKEIGNIISHELKCDLEQTTEIGDNTKTLKKEHPINFASIRSGEIPASHQIIFGFENERLELAHHAYNMKAFADGMVEAGIFLHDRKKGCYSLSQVFNQEL